MLQGGGIFFTFFPMKKISFAFLLLAILFSCQQEADDRLFTIGTYDELDFHQSFSSPVKLSTKDEYGLDMDQDGTKDVFFKLVRDEGSNYLISSIFVELARNASSRWEVASLDYIDSVYICLDTNTANPVNVIYNLNSGYQCPYNSDSLVNILSLSDMAFQFEENQDLKDHNRYGDVATFHRYENSQGPEIRFFFYDYYQGGQSSYIALRRTYANQFQYAWVKVKLTRDASDQSEADLEIIEYAVQAYGRS